MPVEALGTTPDYAMCNIALLSSRTALHCLYPDISSYCLSFSPCIWMCRSPGSVRRLASSSLVVCHCVSSTSTRFAVRVGMVAIAIATVGAKNGVTR
jgi:hypothetical protein